LVPNSNPGNSVGVRFLPSNLPVNLLTLFYEHSNDIPHRKYGQGLISSTSNAYPAGAAAELRRFQTPFSWTRSPSGYEGMIKADSSLLVIFQAQSANVPWAQIFKHRNSTI